MDLSCFGDNVFQKLLKVAFWTFHIQSLNIRFLSLCSSVWTSAVLYLYTPVCFWPTGCVKLCTSEIAGEFKLLRNNYTWRLETEKLWEIRVKDCSTQSRSILFLDRSLKHTPARNHALQSCMSPLTPESFATSVNMGGLDRAPISVFHQHIEQFAGTGSRLKQSKRIRHLSLSISLVSPSWCTHPIHLQPPSLNPRFSHNSIVF